VNFVKTSTGQFPGASIGAVTAMINAVNGQCGVKASGGVKTYEDACTFLDLGCERLGSSSFLELLQ
jgi:deoxyribose-phosphate aldolase